MSGSILFSSSEHPPRGRQHYLLHSSYRVSGPTSVSLSSLSRRRLDAFAHPAGGDNSDEESLVSEQLPLSVQQVKTYDHKQWKAQLAAASLDPQDVNRLVMDYFTMCGHKDAAEAFSRESNTPLPSLSRTIGVRDELRRLILDGNIPRARALVASSFPKVAEHHAVSFELLQQEFIELVRQGQPVEALSFSQGDLAKLAVAKPEFMESLEQVMLLAFIPGIEDGKLPASAPAVLNKFWDTDHRTAVHRRVLEAILSAECGRTVPRLPGVLKQLQYEQRRATKSLSFPKMIDLAMGAFEPPPDPPAASENGASTSSRGGTAAPSERGSSSVSAYAVAGSSSSAQQQQQAQYDAAVAASAAGVAAFTSSLMALAPMSDDPPQQSAPAALQLQQDPSVPLSMQAVVAAIHPPHQHSEDDASQQSGTGPDGDDDDEEEEDEEDEEDDDSAMVDS